MMADINDKNERSIANKLHRQFAHPTSRTLNKLIKNAGIKNKKLEKEVDSISDKCITCVKFQKRASRPIVCTPMATEFNEMIAIDLKVWGKHYFLVIVDLATRFCAACVISNKVPTTIIKGLFISWIAIFGPPNKIMSDNGGEFSNPEMRALGESFSIKLITTAAESPWSNGVCERLNGVLGKLVLKILDDVKCAVQIALAWAVYARNSYYNNSGFTPNQLVFGFNPGMPDIYNSKLPGFEKVTSSEIVRRNLEAQRLAKAEFVKFDSCEKIRRALKHNVRKTLIEDLEIGDEVYYKRNNSEEWHGPAKVVLIDRKVVEVRHGGVNVRVHTVSLTKAPKENSSENEDPLNTNKKNDGDLEEGNEAEVSGNEAEDNEMHYGGRGKRNHGEDKEMEESDDERPNKRQKLTSKVGVWKKGQRFQGIDMRNGKYISGKILSRAGKITRNNKTRYNIERDQDGYQGWFDLKNVKDLSVVPEETEMVILFNNNAVALAKEKELQSWIENNVFETVEDMGQKAITVRWVLTEKVKNGQIITKARLVARGFEENTANLKKDAPTCSREAIHILIALASSNQWNCHTVDVKSAYLQGDNIQRELYLRPPKEFDDGNLWLLKKTVYGLCDAARAWYMRVKSELKLLSVKMCPLDNSLFSWYHNGKLQGIICIYVDDFLWTGTELFNKLVIQKLKSKFLIGSSSSITFTYVGLSIKAYNDGITIDQNQYISSLTQIPIGKIRASEKKEMLIESEKKAYRTLVGQLNWVATHTRPDIAFDTCELSVAFYSATVADLLRLNKLVERVKRDSINLFFPRLQPIENCTLECYTDASLMNLPNGKSQGGLIIFLQDKAGQKCPIFWKSKKLERTVRSTIAAEAQALADGSEMAYYLLRVIALIIGDNSIKVKCYTDNKSIVDALSSTKQMNKKLKADTLVLTDMIERGEIEVTWIKAKDQLADALTKRGVCTDNLKNHISRD